MPPDRTTVPGRKPFKPPRPSNSSTNTSSKSQPQSTWKPRPSGSGRLSGSFTRPSQSQDPFGFSQEQEREQDENDNDDDSDEAVVSRRPVVIDDEGADPSKAKIPPELLTRILHELMKESGYEKMRVGKSADKTVARYVDCFVREAIARAVWERRETEEMERGGRGLGGGFLEVEDLEKLAPQLVLDF